MNNTMNVGPGCIVTVKGQNLCIKSFATPDSVKAQNLETGIESIIKLGEISETLGSNSQLPLTDLTSVSDDDWDGAIDIYNLLKPLIRKPDRTRKDIAALSDETLISPATLYRYIEKIEKYGTVTCLLRKTRLDKNSKKIDPRVEEVIKEVITTEYLTKLKRSPTKTYREIERRCKNSNFESPGKSTILRRIEEILPEEREFKRNGRNAALDFRPERGSLPGANTLHSIWQIDHTKVDIMLVDEIDRICIGRPWITLAIDVFSRTVVGWYISFDPPGTLGTGICISNAILAKDEILMRLGIDKPWPCQGKPRIIQADNAKEFRGNTLKNACAEHSFEIKFRKVKKPNYGAHIERLLGTLLNEIHGIEGTTFSNSQQKGEYDSEGNATMTLDEFEKWLANLILGIYHNRKHSSLECSPLERYKEGIFGTDEITGIGLMPIAANPEKLRIDFLPYETRTIQPYGVVLDHIEYHDPVLDKWIGSLDQNTRRLKRQFVFRRDPRNISYLIFWDPDAHEYYRIPYKNARRPTISLWELKAVKNHLNKLGKNEHDEEMIFETLNELRRIEDEAKKTTRKVRLENERRKKHQHAPELIKHLNNNQGVDVFEEPHVNSELNSKISFADITPYDEIEPM